MVLHRNVLFGALGGGLLVSQAVLGAGADIMVVIDESGSMAGEHAWIGPTIVSLNAELASRGFTDNRFALVGYGGGNDFNTPEDERLGRKLVVGSGDFGTAAEFSAATANLKTNGAIEDGYAGINFSLSKYTFRNNVARNVIFITDEDRDVTDATQTFATVKQALTDKRATLNTVVNARFDDVNGVRALGIDSDGNAFVADGVGGFVKSSGGTAVSGTGNTLADYVDLAVDLEGAAWDLNLLRAGGTNAESFSAAFIDAKVQEIISTNLAPELDDFVINLDESGPVSHTFLGTDPNGDALIWELVGADGTTNPIFDPETHLLNWDLTGFEPGTYIASVKATDPGSLSDTAQLTVNIGPGSGEPNPPTPAVPLPAAVWAGLSTMVGFGATRLARSRRR